MYCVNNKSLSLLTDFYDKNGQQIKEAAWI